MKLKYVGLTIAYLLLIHSDVYTQQAKIIRIPMDQPTIQAGIDSANNRDTVLVSDGTYYEFINFNGKDIVVASEFLTTGLSSHIENTIIDGEYNGVPVSIMNGESQEAHFIGFTVRNGSGTGGGGMRIDNSSPHLSHLIISENTAYSRGTGPAKIGLERTNYPPGGSGGGVLLVRSKAIVSNILFYGNTARDGSAFYIADSSNVYSEHITVAGNLSWDGSALTIEDNSKLSVLNSIIWGNDGMSLRTNDSAATISYSDIEGGWVGLENSNKSPHFINSRGGNFRLSAFSPCIGRGKASDNSLDLDGRTRPMPLGSFPDLGVYEHIYSVPIQGASLEVDIDSLAFDLKFIGDSVSIALHLTNPGTLDLSITNLIVTPDDFSVKWPLTAIGPENSDSMIITFRPRHEGAISGILRIVSNSVTDDTIIVQLFGRGVLPPFMNVTPDRFDIEIRPGERITRNLSIENQGFSNLQFSVRPGKENFGGHSLRFNGTSTYLMCDDDTSLNIRRSITVEAWINAFDWDGNRRILQRGGDDNQYRFLAEWGDFKFEMHGVDGGAITRRLPTTNTWHHMAAVYDYDAQIVSLYEDGNLLGRQPANGEGESASEPLYIGTKKPSAPAVDFFNGCIDEIRIWNIARTQEQIKHDRFIQLTGMEKGLVGYWNLNEGSGRIANDYSRYENHASLVDAVVWDSSFAPISQWIECSIDSCMVEPQKSIQLEIGFDGSKIDTVLGTSEIVVYSNDPLHRNFVIPVAIKIVTTSEKETRYSTIPLKFGLSQNYPNPFNPTTVIIYDLPAGQAGLPGTSSVKLAIYDLLGREVAMLVNEKKSAGSYSVLWDASRFSNGVYFYKLTAGSFVQTRRMLLLK